jgi:hypothetical protein
MKLTLANLPQPAWLRRLRARLEARSDTEHEQALVRLALGLLLGLYLLPQWTGPSAGVPLEHDWSQCRCG